MLYLRVSVAPSLALLAACQTTAAREPASALTASQVHPITCADDAVAVTFRLVPPATPPPLAAVPADQFADDATVYFDDATHRLRLDGCLGVGDDVTLRRIVVGRKEPGEVNGSFSEFYLSNDDIAAGYQDALFGGDHEPVNIVERLGLLNLDKFRIRGFAHGGSSYVAAGALDNSLFPYVMVGRLEPGDTLGAWFGACDYGYDEFPTKHTIGSAHIQARTCVKFAISGESHSYGLEVTIQDDNQRLPESARGTTTFVGPEARQVYEAGTNHHGCWPTVVVKTPHAEYRKTEKSSQEGNAVTETVTYQGHEPLATTTPAPPFPAPC